MRTLSPRGRHRAAATEEQLTAEIEQCTAVIRQLMNRNAALLATNHMLLRQLRAAEAELRAEPIRLTVIRSTTFPAGSLTATSIPQHPALAA